MTEDAVGAVMRRADRALTPLALTIEVTHRCNLRCVHCYAECGAGRRRADETSRATPQVEGVEPVVASSAEELSTEEWKDLLSQAADLGALYLTVTGGEPVLREDLFELIESALGMRYAVRLLTNGTLVGDAEADRLAELGLIGVEISVYGTRSEVHDRITTEPGSFDAAIAGIRRLTDRGVPVTVKMPVIAANAGEVGPVHDLAESLSAQIRVDPMITPTNAGDAGPTGLRVDSQTYAAVVEELKRRGASTAAVDRSPQEAPCTAGRTQAAIGPTGLLAPCVGFPVAAADLRVGLLARAWREAPLLERLRGIRLADLPRCADCELAAYCRRCPGLALLESGDERREVAYACMMASACRASDQGE